MDFRNLVNRRARIELEYRILDLEGTSLPKGDIYSPPQRANINSSHIVSCELPCSKLAHQVVFPIQVPIPEEPLF